MECFCAWITRRVGLHSARLKRVALLAVAALGVALVASDASASASIPTAPSSLSLVSPDFGLEATDGLEPVDPTGTSVWEATADVSASTKPRPKTPSPIPEPVGVAVLLSGAWLVVSMRRRLG